jgi:hypothetical protein
VQRRVVAVIDGVHVKAQGLEDAQRLYVVKVRAPVRQAAPTNVRCGRVRTSRDEYQERVELVVFHRGDKRREPDLVGFFDIGSSVKEHFHCLNSAVHGRE